MDHYTLQLFFSQLKLSISKGLSEGSLDNATVSTYINVGKFLMKDLENGFVPQLQKFAVHETPTINLSLAKQMVDLQKAMGPSLTTKYLMPFWKIFLENSCQEVKVVAASTLFQFFKDCRDEQSRIDGIVNTILPILKEQLSLPVDVDLKKSLVAALMDIGQLIPKKEVTNHLLPTVFHLLKDENPEIQLLVLNKINWIIESRESEELGEILQAILDVVKALHLLQPPSAWKILLKCDEQLQLISTLHSRKELKIFIMPIIRGLSQSNFIRLKFCAVSLIVIAFSKLNSDKGKPELREMFQTLCTDLSKMVRYQAANKLYKFSALMDFNYMKQHLLPSLLSLLGDQQITVKRAAVNASFDLITLFPDVEKVIMPVMRMKATNDVSIQVRCKIAQRFPDLIESLESSEVVERQLVLAYLSLLQDPEATVRGVAASRLADFCYALNRDLRTEAIVNNVLPCVKELIISEPNEEVRVRMAAAVSDLSPLIGTEMTMEHLMPLFLLQLNDPSPRVKLNFLDHLVRVRNILTFGQLNISLIPKLISILRDLELSQVSQLLPLFQSSVDFFRIQFHAHGSNVADHNNFVKQISVDESKTVKILACHLIPLRINMGLHPQSVTEQLLLFGDLCGSSEEMIALAAANNFKQLVREKLSESHGSTEVEVTLETIVIPLFVKLANHDKESVRLAVLKSWEAMTELLMTLVCNRRNSPVLFSTLMQFANDVSQEIRCMVAGYLPYLRAVVDREAIERDVVPAFVALLQDSDGKVRAAAAHGVAEFCKNLERYSLGLLIMQVIFPCVEMLVTDTDQNVKSAIAATIIELGPLIGVENMVERLSILLETLLNDHSEVASSLLMGYDAYLKKLQLKTG